MTPHCIQETPLMQNLLCPSLHYRINLIFPFRLTVVHHLLLPPEKFRHWLRSTFSKSSHTLFPTPPVPPDVGPRDIKHSVSTPPFVTRTQPRTLISRNSWRCKLMVRMLLSDTAEPQKARFRRRRCGNDNAMTSTLVSERAQQKLWNIRYANLKEKLPNRVSVG